jgi:putative nucleotidyltransferase with HDIG domain
MSEGSERKLRARYYLAFVCFAGAAVLGASLPSVIQSRSADWLILAGLTFLTGSFTVKVPSVPARLSVSETFAFAAVLLYGPGVATVIVALDGFVMSLRLRAGRRSMSRVFFNTAGGSVAIWISAQIFFLLAGSPSVPVDLALEQLLLPVATLAISYFLLNSSLISIALSFEREVSAYRIWRTNFVWLILNYIGGASVAILLVSYTQNLNLTALGIIVPILLTTYLTFRMSLGRLDDANRHVEQVNALYMSAIEALAMAVDAKDQITHGHIRRVQVYATELAKQLGVTDQQQLQAIEAAALLHDMGKLAIPEHILNKPGRLTAAEFEKMKRHSDIGADLLASIPFPYPVVPIVRHHHENWDGTGYPNRIAGTDIPLGARILAVVDCFDALTSDRPYRPRLSTEAAFAIIQERRGTMYDPLIVDTLVSAYASIAPSAIRAGEEAKTLVPSTFLLEADKTNALDEIHAGSTEGVALLEVRRLLSRVQTPSEALAAIWSTIRQITPATVVALYYLETERDVLRCAHAVGDNAALLIGFEIPNGERTTGWAAAHQCSIMNSAASLDLGSAAEASALKSTLCAPVKDGPNLIATLTLYSTLEAPFADRHQYLTEQIASFLVPFVRPALRHKSIVSFPEQPRLHVRNPSLG